MEEKFMKEALKEAQKALEKSGDKRLELDKAKLAHDKEIDWYKAKNDKKYNEEKIKLDHKHIEAEVLELYDSNPRNDEIKNIR